MPLRRGKAVGYDADLMTFKFTMRNGQQIVQCQVSVAALSDLADRRRGSTGDLQAEFKANRELIEAIASALFNRSSNVETRVISIFSKHIRHGRFGKTLFGEAKTKTNGQIVPISRDLPPNEGLFQKSKQIINLDAGSF